MRWTSLFDDLEAQLRAVERAELEAEIAEHTRAERSAVGLCDRLAAGLGGRLRLEVHGAGRLEGELTELGLDWLVLAVGAEGRTDLALLPVHAVLALQGLTGRADPGPPRAQRRMGLRNALRAISRDRSSVRVTDVTGGRRTGRIDRVGRDHLDLHTLPEGAVVADGPGSGWGPRVTVPYVALAAVVSVGGARA